MFLKLDLESYQGKLRRAITATTEKRRQNYNKSEARNNDKDFILSAPFLLKNI
jgi:hypothetical protein